MFLYTTKGNKMNAADYEMDEAVYAAWMEYFEEYGLTGEQADEQYDGRDA